MSDKCHDCDRAGCPWIPFESMGWEEFDEHEQAVTEAARDNCGANKVDWRARALLAEREVDRLRLSLSAYDEDEPLHQEIVALTAKNIALESDLAARTAECERLRVVVDGHRESVEGLIRAAVDSAIGDFKEVCSQRDDARAQLAAVTAERGWLVEQVEHWSGQARHWQREADIDKVAREEMQSEVDAMRPVFEHVIAQYRRGMNRTDGFSLRIEQLCEDYERAQKERR